MSSKRIAILVSGLPPGYNGGAEIAALQIAQEAAARGHEVHLLAADSWLHSGTAYRGYASGGLRVRRLRSVPIRYLYGLSHIPESVYSVLCLKPDIVHAQALYCVPSAELAYRIGGTPYLFYERGGIYLPGALNRLCYTYLIRGASRVVAQTEHQRAMLRQQMRYCRPVEVIPNGVDISRFGKLSKSKARAILNLPQNKKVVLALGRCRPEKSLGVFVRAAVRRDSVYLAVGDGPQLRELRRLADGRVAFVGAASNERDVPTYLCAADVLVNTSRSEGFPMAVLEAMASGLPVVAPRVCGIPEIVEHGVNGMLTVAGDPYSTADAIDTILDSPGMAQSMGEANRAAAQEYSWSRVVEKLYG